MLNKVYIVKQLPDHLVELARKYAPNKPKHIYMTKYEREVDR